MAWHKPKPADSGGGENTSFDDEVITRSSLKSISKQIATSQEFYELEVFEVMDIYRRDGNPKITTSGQVLGRYLHSEQGTEVKNLFTFTPLNPNILQHPIVGELWLGVNLEGKRYYLAPVNDNIDEINFEEFDKSIPNEKEANVTIKPEDFTLNSNKVEEDYKQGSYFEDVSPLKLTPNEGDTLIHGRFGNSIRLGANQREETETDTTDSPNIKLVAGNLGTLEELEDDKTSIYLTTNELVLYPEPALTNLGDEYRDPQLILDSDRIVLNAKKDEIGIYSQNNINISSEDGDVLIKGNNSVDVEVQNSTINLKAIKGGSLKETFNPDGNIMLPKMIVERAGDLKPMVEFLKLEMLAIPSLILPPVLPGGAPNLAFMAGMKLKFDQIKHIKEQIERFISLEWLPEFNFEFVELDKVLDELGLPAVPGFDTLGGFEGILSDIAAAKAKVEVLKATASSAVDAIKPVGDRVNKYISTDPDDIDDDPEDFLAFLDEYESNPDNPPIDTSDIRDVISSVLLNSGPELGRYFQNGGSPELQNVLTDALKAEQDVQQLDQVIKLAEISKAIN